MSSFNVVGTLIAKSETQQVSDKFKKREFVLMTTDNVNGTEYPNPLKMQAVQAKCDVLDKYAIGSQVSVSFNVKGNSYTDKKDGSTKYIVNLDMWKIEPVAAQAPQQTAPVENQQAMQQAIDSLPF
jgi:single-strand DNA-binding protein